MQFILSSIPTASIPSPSPNTMAAASASAAAAASTAATDEFSYGGDPETLIEIVPSSSPLDLTRYICFVRDPAAGALATFEGTTRDTFEGRRVVELQYEAYVPMAARRLSGVCASARSAWSLRRIAVAHRLGTVPVGEASVFVATSAVHRADAMEACRFVIDEIKASVPIWKKEVYDDGEVWKENKEFFERRPAIAAAEQDRTASRCCGSKVRVEDDDVGVMDVRNE